MSGFDPLSPENRFEADDYEHFIEELQRIIYKLLPEKAECKQNLRRP